MSKRLLISSVGALALCGAARAQLIVGLDDTAAGATNCWHVDTGTGTATPLFSAPIQAWGLAADEVGRVLYANNGVTLYRAPYGAAPLTVTTLGSIVDVNTAATLSFVGLAWANGELYGIRNVTNEAVFHIETDSSDPDYLKATVVLDYAEADYDLGGFEFNPADGFFYATNDDALPFGSGLFKLDVFGGGAITLVTAYPPLVGANDCDGLAIGNNKAYFIEDQAADIDVYDLVAGTFGTPLASPIPTSEVFSSGCWAPSLFAPAAPISYCTSGTTTNGCLASITATANPSVSLANSCTVTVSNVEGLKNGIVFYGLASNNAPWAIGSNSTLCVKTPTQRTGAQLSGGTVNACDGTFTLDWNAFQTANPGALGQPWVTGEKAYVQAWFRDPPAIKTTNLSNGVQLTYVP